MRRLAGVLAGVVMMTSAQAEPVQLVHQSRIVDSLGQPIEGLHTVRVGLWTTAALETGSEQWGHDFPVTLQDGYFNVILGSDTVNNPLQSTWFTDSTLYVQISVDTDPVGQRTPLGTVPYAVHAMSASQSVPVGTILPYAGDGSNLDANWVPCDGRTVADPGPGLQDFGGAAGVQVPTLNDNRFLMGVNSGSIGATGGRNDIPSDGNHTHSFSQTSADHAPDASHFTDGSYTNPAGAHTHGGENRPLYMGVQYIIRVR